MLIKLPGAPTASSAARLMPEVHCALLGPVTSPVLKARILGSDSQLKTCVTLSCGRLAKLMHQ